MKRKSYCVIGTFMAVWHNDCENTDQRKSIIRWGLKRRREVEGGNSRVWWNFLVTFIIVVRPLLRRKFFVGMGFESWWQCIWWIVYERHRKIHFHSLQVKNMNSFIHSSFSWCSIHHAWQSLVINLHSAGYEQSKVQNIS